MSPSELKKNPVAIIYYDKTMMYSSSPQPPCDSATLKTLSSTQLSALFSPGWLFQCFPNHRLDFLREVDLCIIDLKLLMRDLLLLINSSRGWRISSQALRCLWIMSGKALDWDLVGLVGVVQETVCPCLFSFLYSFLQYFYTSISTLFPFLSFYNLKL